MTRLQLALLTGAMLSASVVHDAGAQTLGTFRWQMQPYCNVVTVTVTQAGAVYRLEGTDDQCGAGQDRASVTGLAFQNPNGTIGFGLTIVTAPGGQPVHVDAEVSLATLSGSWRGTAGGPGPFVFTPGAPAPGSPRPAPTSPSAIPTAITLDTGGSIVARPNGQSAIPVSGSGSRMMWYAGKAAFRAGAVGGSQWDDANIGVNSVAFGENGIASGRASAAFGGGSKATGTYSVALGQTSSATGTASLAFGWNTTASGDSSVAGGSHTTASGIASTALGSNNTAAGADSIAGGFLSAANGRQSFAYGDHASTGANNSFAFGAGAATSGTASGSMMLADATGVGVGATPPAFLSTAPNEFGARFAGGFYLYTRADLGTGAALAANGSSWAALSDVNAKENFADVDGEDLLARLARVPIREWNYKAQDPAIRHMGPTAQDFRAAFGLGDFPLRINTIDADGVALAAVKALVARTEALQAQVDTLQRRLEEVQATSRPER
jgi:hypothetical protein